MPSNASRRRSGLAERLRFLRAFVAHPRRMGALLPTTRAAVDAMLDLDGVADAGLVLELGAGTGSHTRAILDRMGPTGRLIAVEIDPELADAVRTELDDPRLEVVTDSAERLHELLNGRTPEVIVSALPFTSLPAAVSARILDRAAQTLPAHGTLLVLQYSPVVTRALRRRFASVERTVSPRNVPPAFLFACRRPRRAEELDRSATTEDDPPR